ncbi:hypothetical protein GCM10011583_30720 [Streptomyces camponoticapitis]|uniref:Uncharacterized protein n=1 Tax=Streptomyces camponoticapitis TaxID=1616125 RepID=A0ABQ2E6D9_9ACTN|nr:hypothetical protein GCM10011583_30720 [Streptomyces camponoticapitis]
MFQPELVHPAGETRVGETGFCDERGELAVGDALRRSFRHQLYGLLPSGPREQPSWNGANLAVGAARTVTFVPHSSDRVRIAGLADVPHPPVLYGLLAPAGLPDHSAERGRTVAEARYVHVPGCRGDTPGSHPPDTGRRRRRQCRE